MSEKTVYWHLPGLCSNRLLNQIIINLMHDHPDKFRDGYKIGSAYGTIGGAIWNGGRAVMGFSGKDEIAAVIKGYNDKGVPVRFTWTNALIEEKHVTDTYCNLIMRLADNGMNQVLVNAPVLEEYIKKEYPSFPRISSTTKRLTKADQLEEELKKDYFLVVLDYDLNHDEKTLKQLEPYADRVEILVNEVCYPECPLRTQHYLQQSRMQLEFDVNTAFPCPNKTQERVFAECMNRPAFISKEQIRDYIDRGYVNFKIVGRGMPLSYSIDSYIYYLVKDEEQDWVRKYINDLFAKFRNMQQMQRRK